MQRKIRTVCGAVAAFLVLSGALPALGAEGRHPIWQPISITGDGKFIVTRNITSGGTPIIVINGGGTETVSIDFNGMTLTGGVGAHTVEARDLDTLVLKNGIITGSGGDAIHVERTGRLVVEDFKVTGGDHGLFMEEVSDFAVRRNFFVDTLSDGIFLDALGGAPVPPTGIIEDNLVRNAGNHGIAVVNNHSAVTVLRNRVDNSTGADGIHLAHGNSCIVAENTVANSARQGLHLVEMTGCKVYNNDTAFNNENGILLRDSVDSLVLDNVSSQNTGSGITTFLPAGSTARNHFDRNVLNQNACYGLWLSSEGNTFGRNTARSNGGAGACPPPAAACTVANPGPAACWPGGAPGGPGLTIPDVCNTSPSNTTFCDNLMPGPPTN